MNSAPHAKRTSGPKVGADSAPTKNSPGTVDSKPAIEHRSVLKDVNARQELGIEERQPGERGPVASGANDVIGLESMFLADVVDQLEFDAVSLGLAARGLHSRMKGDFSRTMSFREVAGLWAEVGSRDLERVAAGK